jgi:hypothetical protein
MTRDNAMLLISFILISWFLARTSLYIFVIPIGLLIMLEEHYSDYDHPEHKWWLFTYALTIIFAVVQLLRES